MADGVDIDLYADVDHEFAQDDSAYGTNASAGNVDLYDDMLQPSRNIHQHNFKFQKPNSTTVLHNGNSGGMQYNYQGKKVSIYIGNLTWWTTDQDLQDAIASLGVTDLIEIKFYENRANGQSKGFAVVHLATETSSRIVMDKLPNKEIHGQNPVVTPCNRQSLNQFEQQSKAQSGGGPQTPKAPTPNPPMSMPVFTSQSQPPPLSLPMPAPRFSTAPTAPAQARLVIPPPGGKGLLPMPPPVSIPPPGMQVVVSARGPPPAFPPGMLPPPGPPPPGMPPMLPPRLVVGQRGPPQPIPRVAVPPISPSQIQLRLPPPGLPPPGLPIPPPGMLPIPTSAPPPAAEQSSDYRSNGRAQSPPLTETEVEEIMNRNRAVSSSAISRAVSDASAGDYGSAIETLVTAISLIKQSKVASDERAKVLIGSLQDCLHGIEEKSFGSRSKRDRSRDRDRDDRRHRESKSRRRDRDRDRDRSRSRDRDRYDERDYRERSRDRDSSYTRHDRDRDRHRR